MKSVGSLGLALGHYPGQAQYMCRLPALTLCRSKHEKGWAQSSRCMHERREAAVALE